MLLAVRVFFDIFLAKHRDITDVAPEEQRVIFLDTRENVNDLIVSGRESRVQSRMVKPATQVESLLNLTTLLLEHDINKKTRLRNCENNPTTGNCATL